MIKQQFLIKGQLKRRDKLTSIERSRIPENGFEGTFENFVFVLEISAVISRRTLRDKFSVSIVFRKILSGDFCL